MSEIQRGFTPFPLRNYEERFVKDKDTLLISSSLPREIVPESVKEILDRRIEDFLSYAESDPQADNILGALGERPMKEVAEVNGTVMGWVAHVAKEVGTYEEHVRKLKELLGKLDPDKLRKPIKLGPLTLYKGNAHKLVDRFSALSPEIDERVEKLDSLVKTGKSSTILYKVASEKLLTTASHLMEDLYIAQALVETDLPQRAPHLNQTLGSVTTAMMNSHQVLIQSFEAFRILIEGQKKAEDSITMLTELAKPATHVAIMIVRASIESDKLTEILGDMEKTVFQAPAGNVTLDTLDKARQQVDQAIRDLESARRSFDSTK